MGMFDSHGKSCWSQSMRWVCLIQQAFPWLYQTHSPLRLTSARFSMTISNTLTASTEFSRFFHDYIKHTHRFDWLQQVFSWLYQTQPSPRLTSATCSMTISNTSIASTDFSRFSNDYIKHTHRFDWLQQVFDIVMEKPAEVSRSGECVWYSHWKTCWSQSKRWVCLI
jgi:hypothetical protein